MAVCWDVSWQRMRWVGLLTLAWPLTPYRLHCAAVRLDELKHLIVRSVFRDVFSLGFFFFFFFYTPGEECAVHSWGRCLLCDCCTKHGAHALFSSRGITHTYTLLQMDTHLSVTQCLHGGSKQRVYL